MPRLKLLVVTFLTFCLQACPQERSLLSDDIKKVNPYREGQELTFVSSTGIENTLKITKVEDGRFPDGLGAYPNERLVIDAFGESPTVVKGAETRILTLFARDPQNGEKIDFSISLNNTYLQMHFVSFTEYQEKHAMSFANDFCSYDDALVFDNRPGRKIYEKEIVRFYWSKSIGYIRLIQADGTWWDLKCIH